MTRTFLLGGVLPKKEHEVTLDELLESDLVICNTVRDDSDEFTTNRFRLIMEVKYVVENVFPRVGIEGPMHIWDSFNTDSSNPKMKIFMGWDPSKISRYELIEKLNGFDREIWQCLKVDLGHVLVRGKVKIRKNRVIGTRISYVLYPWLSEKNQKLWDALNPGWPFPACLLGLDGSDIGILKVTK